MTSSTVVPGDSTEPHPSCGKTIQKQDRVGRIAVLARFAQNWCYTDGQYNARDFPVEEGKVAVGGALLEAYRVRPPRAAPKGFLASHHVVHYTFDDAIDHAVYAIEGDGVVKLGTIAAAEITAGAMTRLPIDASTLAGPITFFVAPATQRISSFAQLGPGVEGGRIAATPLGAIDVFRYDVAGSPFDTRSTPGLALQHRHIFPIKLATGLGVVWQDPATLAMAVTAIGASGASAKTMAIPNPSNLTLAAATSDNAQTVFVVGVEGGERKVKTRIASVMKLDVATGAFAGSLPDVSAQGLNITGFGEGDSASLAYANGKLGLMLGRTMHQSSDGLNHQGGIAVVFDAATLALVRNHGQTSGHSFENTLSVEGNAFVGIDLGDNYPRGVHLHRFTDKRIDSSVVFAFKTEHGTTAVAPDGRAHPGYPQISTDKTTYYQWSNDNATYSELGGVVADPGGYTVVFANEATGGRALDNSRVGKSLNDPRNIGLVRVRHDFETSHHGSEVPDTLVLSKGASETGGFYAFGGTWSKQRNTGVVWLTNYADISKNATRVKAVGVDGKVLILWEQWSADRYASTFGMLVDPAGAVITPAIDLGASVRLGRRDDVLVDGKTIYLVGGLGNAKQLEVIALRRP